MRKVALTTAVLLAAVVLFLLATLPRAPARAEWGGDSSIAARTVAGAYHVHTSRSDGAEDRASVAQAAARAGLQFLIFTDHGDGTRHPEPAAYLYGVLCLDGVEISTNGGHYVALGVPKAPYPLGGEAYAVIEDVGRLGGFGFAAHVDSPRAELAWTDWSAPLHGIEWMNADSEWRDEPRPRLARSLLDYLARPGPALASLLDRPLATLARWDALTDSTGHVVALAGHDAHGGIGRGVEDGDRQGLPVPSYEASFRSFTTRLILHAPLTKDAALDGPRLLEAMAAGRTFTAIDGLASPGYVDFRASHDNGTEAETGGRVWPGPGAITVHAAMPPGAEIALVHRGRDLAVTKGGRLTHPMEGITGAVRVEVRVPGAPGTPPIPWMVTNPIYIKPGLDSTDSAPPAATRSYEVVPFPSDVTWHVEHDPGSRGQTGIGRGREIPPPRGDQPSLDFRLGPPPRASQFVALAADMEGRIPSFDFIAFDARAAQPMRLSVQLRYGDRVGRWGRSVYLEPQVRGRRVALRDLVPLDGQTGPAPDPATARSVLFVVDLTNATPGMSGHVEISGLRFVR